MCLSVCDPESFGDNCAGTCRCKDNAPCDHINGSCPGGMCKEGYQGSNCSSSKYIIHTLIIAR